MRNNIDIATIVGQIVGSVIALAVLAVVLSAAGYGYLYFFRPVE